jgi:hypothetical protein
MGGGMSPKACSDYLLEQFQGKGPEVVISHLKGAPVYHCLMTLSQEVIVCIICSEATSVAQWHVSLNCEQVMRNMKCVHLDEVISWVSEQYLELAV